MTNHPLDKRCECDACIQAQTMTTKTEPTIKLDRDSLKGSARAALNMRKVTLPSCPAALRH